MEDTGLHQEAEVESSEESLEPYHSYVLHGAQAYCEYGSRLARLTLPKCHGSYIHDMPVMTTEDCKAYENIKVFGFCSSLNNPDRLNAVKDVMEIVEKDENMLDVIMDAGNALGKGINNLANKVAGIFGCGSGEKKKAYDPYAGYGKDVVENVLVQCKPLFFPLDNWSGGTDKLMINGKQALNSNCIMVCTKCGGEIRIADDGQENAISEQHSVTDFENWKEGDPMPEPTARNMEALNENLEQLEKELEQCADPAEKARLQAEYDTKSKMASDLSNTLSMVNDVKLRIMTGQIADEASYKQAVADMETMRSAFKNGTPCVQPDEASTDALLNGAYETKLNGGDVDAYVTQNNTSKIAYDSFEGTKVTQSNADDVPYLYFDGKLMSKNEYNQAIGKYVDAIELEAAQE